MRFLRAVQTCDCLETISKICLNAQTLVKSNFAQIIIVKTMENFKQNCMKKSFAQRITV